MAFDISSIVGSSAAACASDPDSDECKQSAIEEADLEEEAAAAAAYYEKAKTCVDDVSSHACQDILAEGAEEAAIAYGVDPALAEAAVQCAKERTSEACAKAGATLAATAACTAVTEGAAAPLCAKLAPVVVDLVWPVAGPVLTAVWATAWGFAAGVAGGLADFGASLLKSVGFDLSTNAKPTVTDAFWDFLDAGHDAIVPAWTDAVAAVALATRQSEIELDLIPKSTLVLKPKSTLVANVNVGSNSFTSNEWETAVGNLESILKQDPRWMGKVRILGSYVAPSGLTQPATYTWEIVPEGTQQTGNDLMVVGGATTDDDKTTVDGGWKETSEGEKEARGAPWYFAYYGSWGNQRNALADAYSVLLAYRLRALSDAASQGVGSVIARNVRKAQRLGLDRSSSTGINWRAVIPWALGFAVFAGGVGHAYWKSKKAT